jgi:hypothetical protein
MPTTTLTNAVVNTAFRSILMLHLLTGSQAMVGGAYAGSVDVAVIVGPIGVAVLIVGLMWAIVRSASGKGRTYHDGESPASGMFGEIVDIFQPNRTYLTEERERRRMDIAQRPAEGRPFGVDLDAGVAYLTGQPPTAPDPGPATDPEQP